ncbi:sulfite exporter TauE/SafE family protein [Gluconacetobacter takamatsuzukensis]|uniref:Probable membrane transporter protein n=1 Tax=Gluconacetobacter takamatsuzukensis TaxID=1286190 RepID=A0A7W4KE92_9PROT|nr:sulfite exporter TauE/SafE family protein [Gluconacetobacter takamatsuzukensis]MBB2205289.1 sulfite exporter TauE/SafE family protein [Gluconacetobacter takamatsuzukensis]
MPADLAHLALELLSGALVGFTLGLIGGGGSILAVPLMVYVVGVANPHVAIGTSALAVAVNALAGVAQHARAGTVKWRCAAIFASCGVVGAVAGATLGKAMDGRRLLLCFALLMVAVGVLMLRGRRNPGCPGAACNRHNMGRVMSCGAGTGLLSGFFGIGGGFLIVPALVASTGMPILNAIGTSLVAVAAFGASTAISYMVSGLIDWPLALLFIVGGTAGSFGGMRAARALSGTTGALTTFFAGIIFCVAAYMIWRSV